MRRVSVVLLVLLGALQFELWLSDRGTPEVRRLRAMVEVEREENSRLEARNHLLAVEVDDLKVGLEAVEERARSDLGMIGRNETYYQIVNR